MERKNTIVINLFSGPGCGKSTLAAGLFYQMKCLGHDVELVTEYAKELTYREQWGLLKQQYHVTTEQIYRQDTFNGKVDYVITDSPILLGLIYKGNDYDERLEKDLLNAYHRFNNVNFFLQRDHSLPFIQNGRNQDRDRCIEIDVEIYQLLHHHGIDFEHVYVRDEKQITNMIQWIEVKGNERNN